MDQTPLNEAKSGAATRPTLAAIFNIFLLAGAISFGGGVVAYLREYTVRGRDWLDDDEFLDALEIGETLPGLNAVNISVIVGDRLRGALGALVAVVGLMLPGTIMIMALGVLWESNRHNPLITLFLTGVAAAAVGLLLTVTLQLGRKQFTAVLDLLFVAVTFAAVSLLHLSLVWVMLIIGPIAVWTYRPHPSVAPHEHVLHLRERLHSFNALWRH